MVWGAGTGLFNLPYFSSLPTESIIPSLDKSGVFLSSSDVKNFLVSSLSSPSSDTFYPALSLSYSPYEELIMVFSKLDAFRCAWFTWFYCLFLRAIWDRTRTALYCLFFFFFISDIFGASHLTWLSFWGGRISSEWRKDNDLARPIMNKIVIYHVWSRSELFRTTLRTKLRNLIGFDTGTSFACVWCVTNSNTILN